MRGNIAPSVFKFSREAAKYCSPRRKPWVTLQIPPQAPEGAKEN